MGYKIRFFLILIFFLIIDFCLILDSLNEYIINLKVYNAFLNSFIDLQTCAYKFYKHYIEVHYVSAAYKLTIKLIIYKIKKCKLNYILALKDLLHYIKL